MLRALRLRDFVIVDALDLEFSAGFTVLTGETGAGKSILIDALQLVLGGRGDAGVVREGASRADLVAEFSASPALEAWLTARALGGDPGGVMLRRVIEADGRSRALINGHPATVALLREIGEQLLEVHGQHAAQTMLRASGQRDMLDGYARLHPRLGELAAAFAQWREAAQRLAQAQGASREQELERERLQWQVDEISQLGLAGDEWSALQEEHKRLSHAASLRDGARAVAERLGQDDDALADGLRTLLNKLRPLAAIDARLTEALNLLEGASIQAEEAGSLLGDYADRLDLDPERLDQVDRRIGQIFSLARRLRLSPEALAPTLAELQQRLQEIASAQDIGALQAAESQARQRFDALAARLSTERAQAAQRLADGISTHLKALGMGGARFQVLLEPAEASASGIDRVEFRIAAHAGSQARPIARIASGGELSRIGLAIAVLAAEANPVPTLIFDEADAGVGGAVGEAIGQLMRSLGAARQVLCVTHLPQVAARAHQHLSVSKELRDGRIGSRVDVLDRGARVDELARMLAGAEITPTSRKHARELLAAT